MTGFRRPISANPHAAKLVKSVCVGTPTDGCAQVAEGGKRAWKDSSGSKGPSLPWLVVHGRWRAFDVCSVPLFCIVVLYDAVLKPGRLKQRYSSHRVAFVMYQSCNYQGQQIHVNITDNLLWKSISQRHDGCLT